VAEQDLVDRDRAFEAQRIHHDLTVDPDRAALLEADGELVLAALLRNRADAVELVLRRAEGHRERLVAGEILDDDRGALHEDVLQDGSRPSAFVSRVLVGRCPRLDIVHQLDNVDGPIVEAPQPQVGVLDP
jgi:hypothetical protein